MYKQEVRVVKRSIYRSASKVAEVGNLIKLLCSHMSGKDKYWFIQNLDYARDKWQRYGGHDLNIVSEEELLNRTEEILNEGTTV